MMKQTARLIENAEQYAKETCGQGINHISTWRIKKKLAHERQKTNILKKALLAYGHAWRAVHHIKLCTAKNWISSIAKLSNTLQTFIFLF
ncbi:MAG: hypothetical protein JJW03_02475 [Desulfosarcina sp.]|nr:hypothetical protein [Desulfobacterales bacterium]